MRILSLNLRRDVPSDGANAWRHRASAVASLVREQAPAVFATQEGLPHQLADLDALLPAYRRVGGDRDGDGKGEHVALYYDPSRVMLLAHGDVWLSDTPETPGSRSWGNRLPRHATWARFEGGLTVVNTHLDHESEAARVRAAGFLAARFPDAVIVGDFNDGPGSATWLRLAADRVDPHAHETGGTFHGFGTEEPLGRIDFILAPASWLVGEAKVLREKRVSDHHPVVADFTRLREGRATGALP